jgi:hypothetical protein
VAHLDHLPQALNADPELATTPANIVVSGTTMWNPGDDFVRAGVLAAVREAVRPRPLNLFFYNFSANVQPPHGRTGGVGNDVSRGDLEQLGDAIDAVVIAGLSAGEEIKDLYRWVIDAGLTDRVLLIGAGYENEYVERHCGADPEATIFRGARLIVGRTEKTPRFIRSVGTPYAHLPCPSPLSVPSVKPVPEGRRARRIGFSIQLPGREGIINQATGEEPVKLATDAMLGLLDRGHDITLIAHHKTEFIAHSRAFRGSGIKVVFQTFADDLAETYTGLDAMVTTRLHAGLFANAHGLPALIVNDTDRHTHALDGFTHATWANTPDSVRLGLDRLLSLDLGEVARSLAAEKAALMDRYQRTLGDAVRSLVIPEDPRERLASVMRRRLGSRAVKHRVLSVISGLEPDHWLPINIDAFRDAAARGEPWFDAVVAINWLARALRPRTYLEVGVRRGRSLAQVLTESPTTAAFGFDMWIPDYGSIPERGIVVENPGPGFVRSQLESVGAAPPHALVEGDSKRTLPAFFADPESPSEIDLIHVDGDHSEEGARRDLEIAFERIAPGGVIVFDDLTHPSHPELRAVWDSFRGRHPDWLFVEDADRNGTGLAVRPPFDRLAEALEGWRAPSSSPERSRGGTLRLEGVAGLDEVRDAAHAVGPEGCVFVSASDREWAGRIRGLARREHLDCVIVRGADEMATVPSSRVDPAQADRGTVAAPARERAETGVGRGPRTPIHFFTIVLNGMPFIEHHLRVFEAIDGPWHWHIIEGVGDLVADTAWSVRNGGAIPDELHRRGRSIDGTSAYLDELSARDRGRISLYRKPPGELWRGKREMVNAPLREISEACLLWQVDADELWTTDQIEAVRDLFEARPDATAAYYRCHYFVGPDRVITSRDTYGNHTGFEWLRTWRYAPGDHWAAHEPPRLVRAAPGGETVDVASINAIDHDTTEAAGAVFQHFAYATAEQARFKEVYYGYPNAVAQWRALQAASAFPLRLGDFLDWVRDDAAVDLASSVGVRPLLSPAVLGADTARVMAG